MVTMALVLTATLAATAATPPQASAPFQLSVQGAGGRGNLVFTTSGVRFEAANATKSWERPYRELKQIRVESPRKIAFDTFEDGRRWRLGADRTMTFEVTEGAVDANLIAYLLENVARPVATAVLPTSLGDARLRVDAKHLRRHTGTHGAIVVYATGLAYETASPGGSRYWRYSDLESVLRTSEFELLVSVFERGSVRPFAFALKEPLSQDAFDDLWNQVNRPADRTTR